MKKLLTIAACMLASLAVMAQGTVNFSNGTANLVRFASTPDVPVALQGLTAGSAGGPAVSEWHVALYWNGAQLGAAGTFNAGAGRFVAGVRGNSSATPGSETFKVVAWSGSSATYEAALATGSSSVYAGESASFLNSTGGGTTPASALTGFTSLTVRPVPEPTIMALGLLGAAALLIRRRN